MELTLCKKESWQLLPHIRQQTKAKNASMRVCVFKLLIDQMNASIEVCVFNLFKLLIDQLNASMKVYVFTLLFDQMNASMEICVFNLLIYRN
mgnify:CR=1 FL=1